jgi:hypothetical protein
MNGSMQRRAYQCAFGAVIMSVVAAFSQTITAVQKC